MRIHLDTRSLDDYRRFLAIKRLPTWRIRGSVAEFPDEYAEMITGQTIEAEHVDWTPSESLFDYQRDIVRLAIRKRKFAVFADCGLGKTNILLEFAACAHAHSTRNVLIVSPLMVVRQTVEEAKRFYPSMQLDVLKASTLHSWLDSQTGRMGIVNYDAIVDSLPDGRLDGLILDESSMLKSHYGKWATKLIEMGRGATWKLACTGTPAPNDRIEYANHAVFLDAFASTNGFLSTYFVNRGQTSERWVLKDHAIQPFYRALSHWCIFLTNPATYGWKDNCDTIPPINVHIEQVELTPEQRRIMQRHTGQMFAKNAGGITTRSMYSQLAKGKVKRVETDSDGEIVRSWNESVPTNKYTTIRRLVESWPDESTIIWCQYNDEQDEVERHFPDAASIRGSTPEDERLSLVDDFKSGRRRVMISKPKILGFGLNLQIATRQVFSGLSDSYESYYQAVKRSNRYGSTRPLNVHIPVTELEEPMVANVLRKAKMVQHDTETQERMFKDAAIEW